MDEKNNIGPVFFIFVYSEVDSPTEHATFRHTHKQKSKCNKYLDQLALFLNIHHMITVIVNKLDKWLLSSGWHCTPDNWPTI